MADPDKPCVSCGIVPRHNQNAREAAATAMTSASHAVVCRNLLAKVLTFNPAYELVREIKQVLAASQVNRRDNSDCKHPHTETMIVCVGCREPLNEDGSNFDRRGEQHG